MTQDAFWRQKINDAINKPKGYHAAVIVLQGRYIEELLAYHKEYLDEEDFSDAQAILEKLSEYITYNYTGTFKTKRYARELVYQLVLVIGDDLPH